MALRLLGVSRLLPSDFALRKGLYEHGLGRGMGRGRRRGTPPSGKWGGGWDRAVAGASAGTKRQGAGAVHDAGARGWDAGRGAVQGTGGRREGAGSACLSVPPEADKKVGVTGRGRGARYSSGGRSCATPFFRARRPTGMSAIREGLAELAPPERPTESGRLSLIVSRRLFATAQATARLTRPAGAERILA